MDWSTIGLLLGAIGGASILAVVLAGLAGFDLPNFLVNGLAFIWQILKKVVDFILNHLPAPVKILLVIMLVGTVGGFVFANTVGVEHVCGPNGDLYTPKSWLQGWAYVNWPHLDGPVKEFNSTGTSGNIIAQNFFTDSVVTGEDGAEYKIVNALLPVTYLKDAGTAQVEDIVKLPVTNQWMWMYGTDVVSKDQKLPVNVCKYYPKMWGVVQSQANVCVIMPGTESSANRGATANAVRAMLGDVVTGLNLAPTGLETTKNCPSGAAIMLHFKYEYDESLNRFVLTTDGLSASVSGGLKDCARNEALESDDALSNVKQVSLTVKNKGILGTGLFSSVYDAKNIWVYNGEYGPIKVELESGLLFGDVQDATAIAVLANMEPFKNDENSLVQYYCQPDNNTVEYKYASRLKVGGIDPFDTTTLIFMYGIGALIMIFFWLK